jgi:hypothetical protein
MADREKLIDQIYESALRMFLSVPADGDCSCRQYPDGSRECLSPMKEIFHARITTGTIRPELPESVGVAA